MALTDRITRLEAAISTREPITIAVRYGDKGTGVSVLAYTVTVTPDGIVTKTPGPGYCPTGWQRDTEAGER